MGENQRRKRNDRYTKKLDEFPDDFTDDFFHNHTVEQSTNIPVLRNIVYKKIKDEVIDRVANYSKISKDFTLSDKFNVEFDTNGFSLFDWCVIREELQDVGFDPQFEFEVEEKVEEKKEEKTEKETNETEKEVQQDPKVKKLIVTIERSINPRETLEERREREGYYSSDEDDETGM